MADSKKLIQSYQTTHWLIYQQADGLTHEESELAGKNDKVIG